MIRSSTLPSFFSFLPASGIIKTKEINPGGGVLVRKPEKIEFFSLGFAFITIIMGTVQVKQGAYKNIIDLAEVALLGVILLAGAVFCETFLGGFKARIITLVVHLFGIILILNTLDGYYALWELPLLITLYIPVFVSLSYRIGGLVNLAVFIITLILGVFNESPVWERLALSVGSLAFLSLGGTVIYYRERLVNQAETIIDLNESLENLSSANHSFLEHMESVEEDSAEKERFRITRELHDSIGYTMMNISMMMNAASYCSPEEREKMLAYCSKTKELADSTLDETRTILYKLRDIKKTDYGNIIRFFSKLCKEFYHATGVKTEFRCGNLPKILPEYLTTIIKRGVQVGFINALRHGHAEHIILSFWVDNSFLRTYIWNNQPSFKRKEGSGRAGIGLSGLRERVEIYKGSISYGRVEDGYLLIMELPIEEINIG